MRRPPLPTVSDPLPAEFRAMLPALLGSRGRVDAARVERLRTRRALLSQSGTFVGHRRYERGDDLRHLDWAAYARTGELFTKRLQEEDRRAATVVVDLSPSMLAGTPPRRRGALQLAAVLGALMLARVDGVSVVAAGGGQQLARFAGVGQLPALLEHLATLPVSAPADGDPAQAAALVLQGEHLGRVHWVSDFAAPTGFAAPLAALRRRGIRVTGWLPTVVDDEAPAVGGFVRLLDPETGEELHVPIDEPLQRALAAELLRLQREQAQLFAQVGSSLWRWPVPSAGARLPDYLPIVTACSR
ncbi:MAG: DUF58 domain-containing protein [Planctomycetes bacterium]|nr:DUF58 domain-containing protein [Planctomycetota bacterium]